MTGKLNDITGEGNVFVQWKFNPDPDQFDSQSLFQLTVSDFLAELIPPFLLRRKYSIWGQVSRAGHPHPVMEIVIEAKYSKAVAHLVFFMLFHVEYLTGARIGIVTEKEMVTFYPEGAPFEVDNWVEGGELPDE
jgi:hypothetical protein